MQEPIRIAQMMTDMNYGGVEMVVMNYYRHIDRKKVQFDFIVFAGSSIPQREEIERLGGRIFIVPKWTRIIQYERAVQKILRENQYEIVHCHMNTLGVFGLYAAKRVGVPVRILHNHSTAGKGETKKNIMKYMLRPFAKLFPTHLCACSRYAGEWIYGKDADFTVFNNAIDLEKYRYNPEVRKEIREELGIEDKFVIGHIGRFCYQKNHDFLIDIFVEVLKKEQKAVLLLIGEGELKKTIEDKVERLGIEENVLFLGSKADAYRYYQAMDVFVLPSRYEGLPVVGVEAQAAGLPCVMSGCITQEIGLLDSIKFVRNMELPGQWASEIMTYYLYEREDKSGEIRRHSYDIENEARKLSYYYGRQ